MTSTYRVPSPDGDGARNRVRVFPDREALSRAAAERLAELIAETPAETDRFALALAGGSTPRRLYELLAGPYRDRIAWDRLSLFWGDERYVPEDHPESNYGAAREALLRRVPLPPGHVFPIPTHAASPEQAAETYAATLRSFFGDHPPRFDLTLLGLGADGHTASLFPEAAPHAPPEGDAPVRWVEAVTAPPRYATRQRITLTLPAINQSRRVFFLVSGEAKRAPLRAILDDPDAAWPAGYVRAQDAVTWFVDEAAWGKGEREKGRGEGDRL